MKILHTSDWHLGQYFYGKSRANEHKAFFQWLLSQVETLNIDAVIVAGDIFDTSTPPSYARELYFDFITALSQLNCQLVVLAGNHDSVAMLNEAKVLLSQLNTHVITVAESPSAASKSPETETSNVSEQLITLSNKAKTEQIVVCAIPFLRPRDLIKSQAGQSADQKQKNLQQAISDHYQGLFEQAQKYQLPVIMTGHLTTVGSKTTDSVRDIYIGTLDAFPASAFPPADYIALGHIHRPQKVAGSEVIRYCGSPIPLSFDEAGYDKTVNLVEINQSDSDGVIVDVSVITIPRFQPMAMLKTDVEQLAEELDVLAKQHQKSEQQNGLTLWLDIEITAQGYLPDISSRVEQLIENKPIEVLLIRRSKQQRQQMLESQRSVTLDELSIDDVFAARLAQEYPEFTDIQAEDQVEVEGHQGNQNKKQRLTELFGQMVEQIKHQGAGQGSAS
ncbi:exonuclease subunit SbcD [Colwellia sp. MEBiC06753]